MKLDNDGNIDMKQLLLAGLTKWRWIIAIILFGIAAYGLLYAVNTMHREGELDTKMQLYSEEKQQYDRKKKMYDKYVEQIQDILGKGIEENLPKGTTKMEQAYYSSMTLYYMSYILLEADKLREPSNPSVASSGLRNMVIVVTGLAILAYLLVLVYIIISGKILSVDEMQKRYNVRVLSVISTNRERSYIMKRGIDSRFLCMNREEQLATAVYNISAFAQDNKGVLLLGTIDEKKIKTIADSLKKQGDGYDYVISCVQEKTEFYKKLKESENVIVVEEVMSTECGNMDYEMRKLSDWNKNVIGIIGIV